MMGHNLLMNQATGNDGAGGSATIAAAPETSGGGYSAGEPAAKAPEQEVAAKAPTGEQKAAEPKAADAGVVTPAATVLEKLAYELDLKDTAAPIGEMVKEFALKHNLPKEAAQALVELKKMELAEMDKASTDAKSEYESKQTAQRKEWNDELRNDKDLGGTEENYKASLKNINTVLDKFLPNTKSMLTKGGIMLPPSVMKDLHALQKVLLGNDSLVLGGTSSSEISDSDRINNFYNSKKN